MTNYYNLEFVFLNQSCAISIKRIIFFKYSDLLQNRYYKIAKTKQLYKIYVFGFLKNIKIVTQSFINIC